MRQRELQLLVFRMDETCYGIDADQVACLQNYDPEQKVLKFHELVGGKSTIYVTPKMLMVKKRVTYPPVLINEPEDMICIGSKEIRPVPVLMAHAAHSSGVWGIVPCKQGMILLFDFYKNSFFCQPCM
ncbi:hypothetical protein [Pelosinus sp. sgz500959]|uniref:hypothetical protein n=1 Tax=Pelosinus sp. sgz500959 TaxID=3242472 RepID=UPI00366B7C41